MKLALLSDTVLPTDLDYPGAGGGRAIWRLAVGLKARGHDVTVYAGRDSHVPGCRVVEDGSEDQRAYRLAAGALEYDAILDAAHHFKLAHLRPDWPIACKVVDWLGKAPRNRIYGCKVHPAQFGDPGGQVIYEGLDVDGIEFYPGPRNGHLLGVGLLSAQWKRYDLSVETARKAGRDIWLMGDGGPLDLPIARYLPPQSGAAFYAELAQASAVIAAVPAMSTVEAGAVGTPSLSLVDDGFVEDGVTGFVRDNTDALAACCQRLGEIEPRRAREWVADNRSQAKMAEQWEAILMTVANGGSW